MGARSWSRSACGFYRGWRSTRRIPSSYAHKGLDRGPLVKRETLRRGLQRLQLLIVPLQLRLILLELDLDLFQRGRGIVDGLDRPQEGVVLPRSSAFVLKGGRGRTSAARAEISSDMVLEKGEPRLRMSVKVGEVVWAERGFMTTTLRQEHLPTRRCR